MEDDYPTGIVWASFLLLSHQEAGCGLHLGELSKAAAKHRAIHREGTLTAECQQAQINNSATVERLLERMPENCCQLEASRNWQASPVGHLFPLLMFSGFYKVNHEQV